MIRKMIDDNEIIKMAKSIAKVNKISDYFSVGGVGCALVTNRGSVFTGSCFGAPSGIGFCAEQTAIAAMLY